MNKINDKLFGFYRGVVEDNDDPLKVGRVRARIWGLHTEKILEGAKEGIPTEHLPWVEPCLSIVEGSISGFGFFGVPLKGSHIMIFFENGNYQKPMYFASIPGIPANRPNVKEGFNDPDGVYPTQTGVSDYHSRAQAHYPNNTILSVHGGHYIELDSTNGDKKIRIFHNSGTYVEMQNDGSVDINTENNHVENVESNYTQDVGGNATINITGNCNITVDGNTTLTSPKVTVSSPDTIVTGGTVKLGNQATVRYLCDERFIDRYNSHTHDHGDPAGTTSTPNQQGSVASHATSNTKAS